MQTKRAFLCSSVWLLAALQGCGGEDFSAGSAGAGGASGQAGSGQSGSGGAGASGAAGQAGSPAGAGGSTAGQGGSAGSAGGQGGSSGQAGAGASGAGGDSGSAGQAGGASGASGQGGSGGSGECKPGEFSCLGDLLRQCDPQGQYTPKDTCETGLCDADAGKCLTCKPGTINGCQSPTGLSVCEIDGSGYKEKSCEGDTPHCSEGKCVACLEASHCPEPVALCFEASCVQNKCGTKPRPEGYPLEDPSDGDCMKRQCNGAGAEVSVPDENDPFQLDPKACNFYSCKDGQNVESNKSAGEPCSGNGFAEGICNGSGTCGECLPGERACDPVGGGQLNICSALGKLEPTFCWNPTPACSEGECRSVTQLSAGDLHNCALLSNKRVNCWGSNSHGQLGNGDSGPTKVSAGEVVGLANAIAVAAGDQHSCAIVEGGKVFCWGNNEFGQLGAGQNAPGFSPTPIEVKGLTGATHISLGTGFSCAINGNGDVLCWGKNDSLQLGSEGPTAHEPRKAKLSDPSDQIAVGKNHGCSRRADGKVFCWGSREYWQNGDSANTFPPLIPSAVENISGVKSLDASGEHTCVHTSLKSTVCWGRNDKGQLGIKKSSTKESPTSTSFSTSTSAQIALGESFSCALLDGQVECVGSNERGQLGRNYLPEPEVHGPFETEPKPVVDSSNKVVTGVVQVAAGKVHVCALTDKGNVLCWGDNQQGQLLGWLGKGNPDPIPYPYDITTID